MVNNRQNENENENMNKYCGYFFVLVRTVKASVLKGFNLKRMMKCAAEARCCNKLSFHIIQSFMNLFIHCLPQEV